VGPKMPVIVWLWNLDIWMGWELDSHRKTGQRIFWRKTQMQFCGQHNVHRSIAIADPTAVDVCLWPTPFISGQLDGRMTG